MMTIILIIIACVSIYWLIQHGMEMIGIAWLISRVLQDSPKY